MGKTKDTPKKRMKADVWQPLFIEALREYGVVTYAARVAGVERSHVYKTKDRNAVFAEAWDDAMEHATDELEGEARRRAKEGVSKIKFHNGHPIMVPVYDAEGEPVYEYGVDGLPFIEPDGSKRQLMKPYIEHEYSDTLMIFLLKAHRDKFKPNLDITTDGQPLNVIVNFSNDDD